MASQGLFFLSIMIIIYWNGCHDIMPSFLGVIQMAPFWLELLLPPYCVKTKQNKKTTTFYTICRHPQVYFSLITTKHCIYHISFSDALFFYFCCYISSIYKKYGIYGSFTTNSELVEGHTECLYSRILQKHSVHCYKIIWLAKMHQH